MDRLRCTRKITCPETSGNQPTSLLVRAALRSRGARTHFFFSNLTLPYRNFGVNFDGGDGGDNGNDDGKDDNEDGRDGNASDEGDGRENGSGARRRRRWRRRQWWQKMQGAVAGWCYLASGSFSYLV